MKKNIHIKEYSNGVKILFEKDENAKYMAFSMNVFVGAGAEEPEEFGIAHCLEHMMFKSCKKYNAVEISKKLEALGANINAWTSTEATCYHFRCLSECFDPCTEIFGNMLSTPLFLKEEFEQEKNVICEEISGQDDNPEDHTFIVGHVAMMSQNIANPHAVISTKKDVLQKTPKDLQAFMDKHYRGQNIIFSVVGNAEFDEVVKIIEKHFAKYLAPSRTLQKLEKKSAELSKQDTTISLNKNIQQVKLYMFIKAEPLGSPKRYIAKLFSKILGGGFSSRLYIKVREENGFAYTISSFLYFYREFGYLGIYAGINPKNLEICAHEIVNVLKDLAENGVTEEELEKAKMAYKSSLAYSADFLVQNAQGNAQNLFTYGEILSHEEILEKIGKITKQELDDYARQIYNENQVVVCAGGKELATEALNILKKR